MTRPFVGRQRELELLTAAFDRASARQGSVLAVLGQPGIGKTTLCERAVDYASGRGGRVLTGRCYEQRQLALPYLPFIEALRAYVDQQDAATLRNELGSNAAYVARVMPRLASRMQIEPAQRAGEAEEDRYWLLEAMTALVLRAAEGQATLLLLEDLHAADLGSLDLLLHVGRRISKSQLVVVVTYRDGEVDRAHPLSETLAELRRAGDLGRVALGGLETADIQELLIDLGVSDANAALADAVFKHTDGNPLFVHEVARLLLGPTGDSTFALSSVPDGILAVIGQRLARLSAGTTRLLSVAAVIGREFDLAVLQSIAGLGEEELIAAVTEATRGGLLREQVQLGSVRYRFAHALFRQTLYQEVPGPRRIRLHQQVARMLESRYATRLEAHAAELAEHFSRCTDSADLAKAITFFEQAANAAIEVAAFGEATHSLRQALQLLDVVAPDDELRRCDVLLKLGEAMIPSRQAREAAEDVAPRAFALALALDDPRRASRAAQLALEAMVRYGGSALERSATFREWAERADRFAAPDTVERVYADHALAINKLLTNQTQQAVALFERALVLARTLGHGEAIYRSADKCVHWVHSFTPENTVLDIVREVRAVPRQGVNPYTVGSFLWWSAFRYLTFADRRHANELVAEVAALAELTRDPGLQWRTAFWRVIELTLDGDLEGAVQAADRLEDMFVGLSLPVLGKVHGSLLRLRPQVYLGQAPTSVEEPYVLSADPTELVMGPARAQFGAADVARSVLSRFTSRLRSGEIQEPQAVDIVNALDTALLLGDREAAEILRHRLGPESRHLGYVFGSLVSTARLRGAAAALCDDPVVAAACFEEALVSMGRMAYRPEVAMTRLQHAELLLQIGLVAEAKSYLAEAIPELREMRMRPALEHAERLQASANGRAMRTDGFGLTAREREVAVLVADGLTNRDIATRLVISEMTVEVHVKHILNKLGFRSRSQVAVWVAESGRASTSTRARRSSASTRTWC
jgi:DNA-binding CsgD family transcriptional regulator